LSRTRGSGCIRPTHIASVLCAAGWSLCRGFGQRSSRAPTRTAPAR
jgi:hypothetical protein